MRCGEITYIIGHGVSKPADACKEKKAILNNAAAYFYSIVDYLEVIHNNVTIQLVPQSACQGGDVGGCAWN